MTEQFRPPKDRAQDIGRMLPATKTTNEEQKKRYIYLNPAQRLCYDTGARTTYVRSGRGSGKTTGFLTPRYINCVHSIPRSEILFLGNSIKQLYTKTLPAVIQSMEQNYGWIEGRHFFRGQAPKSMEFKMPLRKPRSWENVIHHFNGCCVYGISMEIRASANGFNAAAILSDETRYLPWKKVLEEVMPTLRAGVYDHPGWNKELNPYYLSSMWVSDAGLTLRQCEWEKQAEDETVEIKEQIAEMLAELKVLPELAGYPKFIKRLNRLRGQARVFFNFGSVENADILGDDWFAEQRRILPDLMFNVQIMGQRKGVTRDGYYANFDIDVHGYMPGEWDETNAIYNKYTKKFVSRQYIGGRTRKIEWEAPDLSETSKIHDCSIDTDVDPNEPLRIAFDYGANINCVVTGQTRRVQGVESLLILSSMYVKNERKLRALCGDWCRYYEPQRQRNPDVVFYYDSTARQGGAYALDNSDETKYNNVVKEELQKRGWRVTEVKMGRPMLHDQKFQFISDVLIGRQKPFLRINRERNDYLLVAIDNARVKIGKRGPEKDKDKEKLKSEDGTGGLYETRTDITDAMDTLLIGVRFFRANGGVIFSLPKVR